MKSNVGRTIAVLVIAGLALAGCGASSVSESHEEAVTVEAIEGTDLERLTLTEHAAQRLGIDTAEVTATAGDAQMPYSALLYDAAGETWAYTNPEGLSFVRTPVTVDRISEDVAILAQGPPAGTLVVTVGAAELWGVENGVGGGH